MPAGSIYDSYNVGGRTSGPAYPRVNAIPPWLPGAGLDELEAQYRDTNRMFDTSDYERSNRTQQGRVLTTALNAGTAAAAEYASRARQAGGSGLGAGLVKAQAQVGAQKTAGDLDLERARYVNEHREAAASHASQIASTLGELRSAYLKNIVDYATNEDRINSEYDLGRRRLRAEGGGGNNTFNPMYIPGFLPGPNDRTNYYHGRGQEQNAYSIAANSGMGWY